MNIDKNSYLLHGFIFSGKHVIKLNVVASLPSTISRSLEPGNGALCIISDGVSSKKERYPAVATLI